MSKKGKVIGALIGVVLAGAGGIAGGVALANTQTDKQIAEAKEEGYQEGHKAGYDEGLTVNVGYTDEDLENAKEEGKQEGYEQGFDDGVNYVPEEKVIDISQLGLQGKMYLTNLSNRDKVLSTDSPSSQGIYYFNYNSGEVKQIYNTGNAWNVFELDENNLIFSTSNSDENDLSLLYEIKSNTIKQIATPHIYVSSSVQLKSGKYLIFASGKLYLLDVQQCSLIELQDYTNAGNWTIFHTLSNGDCLISATGTDSGILYYSSAENTVTKIYTSDKAYYNCIELYNGDCLISGNTYKSGLIAYDAESHTVEEIEDCQYYTHFKDVIYISDEIYLISDGSKTWEYFVESKDVSLLGNNFAISNCFSLNNGKFLCSSLSDDGIVLFDKNENTLTTLFNYGKNYNFIQLENGNIECKCTSYDCEYNIQTDEIELIGIVL